MTGPGRHPLWPGRLGCSHPPDGAPAGSQCSPAALQRLARRRCVATAIVWRGAKGHGLPRSNPWRSPVLDSKRGTWRSSGRCSRPHQGDGPAEWKGVGRAYEAVSLDLLRDAALDVVRALLPLALPRLALVTC